jgi:hypothetical protein
MKLASILKIEFTLSNLAHSALVSISGETDNRFVHVQLINSFFKKVFGVEHIRFYKRNGELFLGETKYPFVKQIATLVSSKVDSELTALYSVNPLYVI